MRLSIDTKIDDLVWLTLNCYNLVHQRPSHKTIAVARCVSLSFPLFACSTCSLLLMILANNLFTYDNSTNHIRERYTDALFALRRDDDIELEGGVDRWREVSTLDVIRAANVCNDPVKHHISGRLHWAEVLRQSDEKRDSSRRLSWQTFARKTNKLTKMYNFKMHVEWASRVKSSFVIFDIRALWRSGLSVRVPGCQKLQMTT